MAAAAAAAAPALPALLHPLAEDPAHSALCLDFDGTLAPIVQEPSLARPCPGVPALLARLAREFGLVAVISGRPVAFLAEVLAGCGPDVRLFGLYGLEEWAADQVRISPEAQPWLEVTAAAVRDAEATAPTGVLVEPKGLTVTLHWRHAPEHEGWVEAFAAAQMAGRGLRVAPSRMSLELGPPLDVDKGTVVRSLLPSVEGLRAVAVFGDDLGDLPAFAAVAAVAAWGGVRVAVVDDESPPEVTAQADLTVAGAPGAVALLELL